MIDSVQLLKLYSKRLKHYTLVLDYLDLLDLDLKDVKYITYISLRPSFQHLIALIGLSRALKKNLKIYLQHYTEFLNLFKNSYLKWDDVRFVNAHPFVK